MSSRLWRYSGSLKPGWSASRAIKGLSWWSRSAALLGKSISFVRIVCPKLSFYAKRGVQMVQGAGARVQGVNGCRVQVRALPFVPLVEATNFHHPVPCQLSASNGTCSTKRWGKHTVRRPRLMECKSTVDSFPQPNPPLKSFASISGLNWTTWCVLRLIDETPLTMNRPAKERRWRGNMERSPLFKRPQRRSSTRLTSQRTDMTSCVWRVLQRPFESFWARTSNRQASLSLRRRRT